jgi:hypothetical protein
MITGANQVEVSMETTLEHAQQVVPPFRGMLEQSERGVIFRRAAYQLEWIAHFLITVDSPVQVNCAISFDRSPRKHARSRTMKFDTFVSTGK